MKILFTGGGTLGSVTPLIALLEAWKKKDERAEFFWIGTPRGPEKMLLAPFDVEFFSLPVARFPRYVSTEYLTLPWNFFDSIRKAFQLLRCVKPHIIISAGGYTSVPVIWAGYWLGIPALVHQPDLEQLLSNRLVAPFAKAITVTWKETASFFSNKKTFVVGNPVREQIFSGSKDRAISFFHLNPHKPTVLVVGGGGGADWLNQALKQMGNNLSKEANVIHVTGKGKMFAFQSLGSDYHAFEFLTTELFDALAIADVVVSRCGLGALSELCALKKASILIPLPDSPQEKNARLFEGAATVLNQSETCPEKLLKIILDLLHDQHKREKFEERISSVIQTYCADRLIELALSIYRPHTMKQDSING